MALSLKEKYLWLTLSPEAAKLIIREQGLHSPERLRVITDKNVDNICNIMRKPGSKNADGMHDMVIAQENLQLDIFIFHHKLRCTFDGEVMGVWEGTVHLFACQKRLEDKYRDPNMLPEVRRVDIAWTMVTMEEYLRSCCSIMRVTLAYIIRKTIIVHTYEDYPKYTR